jgi:hypothetical protein
MEKVDIGRLVVQSSGGRPCTLTEGDDTVYKK